MELGEYLAETMILAIYHGRFLTTVITCASDTLSIMYFKHFD